MPAIDAPIQYRGTLTPEEQSYEYDYDPSTGGKQTYEFDTFSEQNAVNLANTNIAARVPTKYRLEHGKATVILADSNFPAIDVWQILANETTKSRYDAPAMLRILKYADGTDFYSNQIQILKQGVDNRTTWASLAGSIDSSIVGSDLTYLSNVYNLLLRGSDVYPISQYVLRHTTNVGNAYASNIADVNVDRVYTVSQLLSETQNSSLWIFPLPGELQYFIQSLVAPANQSGYLWGWLKRSATRTTAAFNRVDLTTEYWLEQWEQTQLGSYGVPAYA
jgi:hypothetical protein